jgi:nickel/cobalt transporter (NiCoT) family protein
VCGLCRRGRTVGNLLLATYSQVIYSRIYAAWDHRAGGSVTAASGRIRRIQDSLTPSEWRRVGGMATTVIALTVLGLVMLTAAIPHHYRVSRTELFGFGTGVLAYTLGMRHAFDADHITAIDNTTRKLMAEGKRPLSVGFWFSLGHSSVVFALAMLLNFGIRFIDAQVKTSSSGLHHWTTIVGTSVSGSFLYLIGALNLVILVSITKVFFSMRRGEYDDEALELQLQQRGLMNRLLGPFARKIDQPWKMYPLGLLFGLGFDTATEVALLVLSGTAVASGLPFWAILSLPILFAAGMSLFDTLDGCFMNFAYGWAFSRPIRKVYYNIVITTLSVAIALFIGTIELFGLVGQELHLQGSLWRWLGNFNINQAGFVIVGVFAAAWAIALAIWRFGNVERRWQEAAERSRARRAIEEALVSGPPDLDVLAERQVEPV